MIGHYSFTENKQVEEFEEIIPTTGALPDLYLSNYKEKFKIENKIK